MPPSKQISFRIKREIAQDIEAAAVNDDRKLAPFTQKLVERAFARYKEAGSLTALREGDATPKPTKRSRSKRK